MLTSSGPHGRPCHMLLPFLFASVTPVSPGDKGWETPHTAGVMRSSKAACGQGSPSVVNKY